MRSSLYKRIHSWHNIYTPVPFLASLPDSLPQLCKQLQLSHLIDSRLSPHPSTLSEPPPPCCHYCPSSCPSVSLGFLGLCARHVCNQLIVHTYCIHMDMRIIKLVYFVYDKQTFKRGDTCQCTKPTEREKVLGGTTNLYWTCRLPLNPCVKRSHKSSVCHMDGCTMQGVQN